MKRLIEILYEDSGTNVSATCFDLLLVVVGAGGSVILE